MLKLSLFNFATILREAKDKDQAFNEVHDDWLQVKEEIEHLRYRFKMLVRSADNLFSELDRRAETITDQTLRQKSKDKITVNKEKYITRLNQSKDSITSLVTANIKVIDMITALEISYTLDTLEGQIEQTFNEIDETITNVMADLASLSVESKALLDKL